MPWGYLCVSLCVCVYIWFLFHDLHVFGNLTEWSLQPYIGKATGAIYCQQEDQVLLLKPPEQSKCLFSNIFHVRRRCTSRTLLCCHWKHKNGNSVQGQRTARSEYLRLNPMFALQWCDVCRHWISAQQFSNQNNDIIQSTGRSKSKYWDQFILVRSVCGLSYSISSVFTTH